MPGSIRLVALDIDGTLAAPGQAVVPEVADLMHGIVDAGADLALLSGKPTAYIAGLARQLGLESAVISGENGGCTAGSAGFPPPWEVCIDVSEKVWEGFARLAHVLEQEFGDAIWLQPNASNLTVFWRGEAAAADVREMVRELHKDDKALKETTVYTHVDSIEVVPNGVSKGSALATIQEQLVVEVEETCAVGDSGNDVPMFERAGVSVGIGLDSAEFVFGDIVAALQFVRGRVAEG